MLGLGALAQLQKAKTAPIAVRGKEKAGILLYYRFVVRAFCGVRAYLFRAYRSKCDQKLLRSMRLNGAALSREHKREEETLSRHSFEMFPTYTKSIYVHTYVFTYMW